MKIQYTMPQKTPTPHHRADPTRAKIIKAARFMFSRYGFAGTSIEKIATKAKINHSLIFHHFTNKQNLWNQVKLSIVQSAESESPILPETNQPLPDFIRELVRNQINFLKQSPDLLMMINWQRMERNKVSNVGIAMSQTVKNWITAIEHYQNTGAINPSLKSSQIVTLIASLTSATALDRNDMLKTKEDYEEYIALCSQAIIRAIANP